MSAPPRYRPPAFLRPGMPNFLLIHDPDTVRRQFAALRARDRVAFLPRMQAELTLTPHYAIAWAAAPMAPVDQYCAPTPDGTDCLLFGEPHDGEGRIQRAEDFCRRHEIDWETPNRLNGYYAALLVHPRRGVRVEADVLGVLPVYHWQKDDVLLVGSSPELFRCHPSFETALDVQGAAALLLTSGLVGRHTLARGVYRLPADHRLLRAPGGSVRELAPPPPSPADPIASVDDAMEQAAELHEHFLRAALRNSRRPGLLLSGGLDSRLLAGFATEMGRRPTCVTFGRPEDLDAHCAIEVAQALELPQTLCDVLPADYAAYALSSVTWEQLSAGLYVLPMGWNLCVRPPASEMDRMICGLSLDAVIGGPKHIASTAGPLAFEQLRIGRLGYGREQLDELIAAPELARACAEIREHLVDEYESSESSDTLREWRMNLTHRHRFAVGACAWRYSLFSWPVMPALDRALIDLARRLPHAVIKDRQVQTRMLVARFPQLARLVLDRNHIDPVPLIAPPSSWLSRVRRKARKLRRRCEVWMGHDPRFYVRTMEFNGPGWRVVRALADDARGAASDLFHPRAIQRLLPPSQVRVRDIRDPIIHSAPLKNTLGLMLRLRQPA